METDRFISPEPSWTLCTLLLVLVCVSVLLLNLKKKKKSEHERDLLIWAVINVFFWMFMVLVWDPSVSPQQMTQSTMLFITFITCTPLIYLFYCRLTLPNLSASFTSSGRFPSRLSRLSSRQLSINLLSLRSACTSLSIISLPRFGLSCMHYPKPPRLRTCSMFESQIQQILEWNPSNLEAAHLSADRWRQAHAHAKWQPAQLRSCPAAGNYPDK